MKNHSIKSFIFSSNLLLAQKSHNEWNTKKKWYKRRRKIIEIVTQNVEQYRKKIDSEKWTGNVFSVSQFVWQLKSHTTHSMVWGLWEKSQHKNMKWNRNFIFFFSSLSFSSLPWYYFSVWLDFNDICNQIYHSFHSQQYPKIKNKRKKIFFKVIFIKFSLLHSFIYTQ